MGIPSNTTHVSVRRTENKNTILRDDSLTGKKTSINPTTATSFALLRRGDCLLAGGAELVAREVFPCRLFGQIAPLSTGIRGDCVADTSAGKNLKRQHQVLLPAPHEDDDPKSKVRFHSRSIFSVWRSVRVCAKSSDGFETRIFKIWGNFNRYHGSLVFRTIDQSLDCKVLPRLALEDPTLSTTATRTSYQGSKPANPAPPGPL